MTQQQINDAAVVVQLFAWWALNWEEEDFEKAFAGSGYSDGYHWRRFERVERDPLQFYCSLDVFNKALLIRYLYTDYHAEIIPTLTLYQSQAHEQETQQTPTAE